MGNRDFYPLAVGNTWTYKMKDGNSFTNTVTKADEGPGAFTMVNSILKTDQHIRKEGDTYLADNFEAGNFQVLLRDSLAKGDGWEIKYKANNFDNLLVMKVKDTGLSVEVEGRAYQDVICIEAESKILMSGNLIPLNFFTQFYYAPGVGLVLTTSSAGDRMGLTSCTVK